jgi:hypothetical protein
MEASVWTKSADIPVRCMRDLFLWCFLPHRNLDERACQREPRFGAFASRLATR